MEIWGLCTALSAIAIVAWTFPGLIATIWLFHKIVEADIAATVLLENGVGLDDHRICQYRKLKTEAKHIGLPDRPLPSDDLTFYFYVLRGWFAVAGALRIWRFFNSEEPREIKRVN